MAGFPAPLLRVDALEKHTELLEQRTPKSKLWKHKLKLERIWNIWISKIIIITVNLEILRFKISRCLHSAIAICRIQRRVPYQARCLASAGIGQSVCSVATMVLSKFEILSLKTRPDNLECSSRMPLFSEHSWAVIGHQIRWAKFNSSSGSLSCLRFKDFFWTKGVDSLSRRLGNFNFYSQDNSIRLFRALLKWTILLLTETDPVDTV